MSNHHANTPVHRKNSACRTYRRPRRFRPILDRLEDRLAPARYTVTTLVDENNGLDVGGVSLREALAARDVDTIDFRVAGAIDLKSALPDLSGNLRILGPGADQLTVRRDTTARFGIFNVSAGADVEIAGLTIQNGHTNSSGGGIASVDAQLTVRACVFAGNYALGNGGGIYFAGNAAFSLNDSTFHGNTAAVDGGGLYVTASANLPATITNSTFSNNSADENAGGLLVVGEVIITHTTIAGNRADSDGNNTGDGGGLQGDGTTRLHHTLIAGNFDGAGSVRSDVAGIVSNLGSYNLIGVGAGMTGLTNGVNGNQVGAASSPIDAKLAPLSDNGGPTLTHALRVGSPALDAGNNAIVTVVADQRGFARISDSGDAGLTATVDIGASEGSTYIESLADKTTREDTSLTIEFLAGDAAQGGLALTISSDNPTLVPNDSDHLLLTSQGASRILRITPASNQWGVATITCSVARGPEVAVETFMFTVLSENDAPVAVDDAMTIDEDNLAAVFLLANDSDADDDHLTFEIISGPAVGSLLTFADHIGYIPPQDFHGTATFTYRADDGTSQSNLATVTITVLPVNDAPTAHSDQYAGTVNTPLIVPAPGVLANDNDVDGDQLSTNFSVLPDHGSLVQSSGDGSFVYMPGPDYYGPDSFSYVVSDGHGDRDSAEVFIDIAPPYTFDLDDDGTLRVKVARDIGRVLLTDAGEGNVTVGVAGVEQTFDDLKRVELDLGENNQFGYQYVGRPEARRVEWQSVAQPVAADHGDLPSSYGDAAHLAGGVYMGNNWDSELSNPPGIAAKGDDLQNLSDEDGVSVCFTGSALGLYSGRIRVQGHAPGGVVVLEAFIDWNHDGDFSPSGWHDEIYTYGPTEPVSGTQFLLLFDFLILSSEYVPTYARFRVSTTGGLGPTGLAADGEVEDVLLFANANRENPPPDGTLIVHGVALENVAITDAGNGLVTVAVDELDYRQTFDGVDSIRLDLDHVATITRAFTGNNLDSAASYEPIEPSSYDSWHDSGDAPMSYGLASHSLSEIFLGNSWDNDAISPVSANALGDDLTNANDEDGIAFVGGALFASPSVETLGTVQVNLFAVHGFARLDGWIDFDHSGSFESYESLFPAGGLLIPAGLSLATFVVPGGALLGRTFARFRLSIDGGLGPNGPVEGGEVEDYPVMIHAASYAVYNPFQGGLQIVGSAGADNFELSANAKGQVQLMQMDSLGRRRAVPLFDSKSGRPLSPSGRGWPAVAKVQKVRVGLDAGDDVFTVTGALAKRLDVDGEAGSDTVIVKGTAMVDAIGIANAEMINVNTAGGNDRVAIRFDDNWRANLDWRLVTGDGTDTVNVSFLPPPVPYVPLVARTARINISSGAGNDQVRFDADRLMIQSGDIFDVTEDGGSGNDRLGFRMQNGAIQGAFVLQINAGIGDDAATVDYVNCFIDRFGDVKNKAWAAAGNDSVWINMHSPILRGTASFAVELGAGDDRCQVQSHGSIDTDPPPDWTPITVNVNGGAGNDMLSAAAIIDDNHNQTIIDDNELPVMVRINQNGGLGDDKLMAHAQFAAPVPSAFIANQLGGAGNDTLSARGIVVIGSTPGLAPPRMKAKVKMDGGLGTDALDAAFSRLFSEQAGLELSMVGERKRQVMFG